ncbi:MAG: ABC transporter ATP-binding protein [Thermodesulfobacteriota bacterium]
MPKKSTKNLTEGNPPHMEKLVEVTGLTKDFGAVRAVNNISFHIEKGEILGLLGPNGAGKTTTLQMLLALTSPTAGSIKILGMDLDTNRQEILQQINFSSSYVSMPFSLTVLENLRIFAMLYSVTDRNRKINELLKTFEIEDIKNQPVRRLSSGQVTRVCLAKAFLNSPKVIFLDEPTASLDPDIADKTRQFLIDIKNECGISLLYTSHNMKEMEELCDRIIFLDRGNIVATGRPEDIMSEYKESSLEEVFLKIARNAN